MQNNNELDIKNEAFVNIALSECKDLLKLVCEYISQKESHYFLLCFFIYFRQLAYYFSNKKSPLIHYKNILTSDEQKILSLMVDFRDASAHLNVDLHWLNSSMMIMGAKNFIDGDMQIQFGKTKLYLLKEIVPLYKKIRTILGNAPELPHLSAHPMWQTSNQEIEKTEKYLIEKLGNIQELFLKNAGVFINK